MQLYEERQIRVKTLGKLIDTDKKIEKSMRTHLKLSHVICTSNILAWAHGIRIYITIVTQLSSGMSSYVYHGHIYVIVCNNIGM